jgi:hypothetical protein
MAALRRFLLRLSSVLRPERFEPTSHRELDAHLTLLSDELQRRGLTPDEARLTVRRTLSGAFSRRRSVIEAPGRLRGSTSQIETPGLRCGDDSPH